MPHRDQIARLQAILREQHLAAWLLTSADPHQSEYPADHWKTRAWLSGFTGSSGVLIVTPEKACLWVDARYHLRAEQETSDSGIQLFKLGLPGIPTYLQWLAQELPQGSALGFNGWLLSAAEVARLERALAGKAIRLSYQADLLGPLWDDRPPVPNSPARMYDPAFAGETRLARLERLRAAMSQRKAQVLLVSALDDIAWTLNLRGSDIEYNPLVISHLIITAQGACLFIDPEKLVPRVREALQQDGLVFSEYDALLPFLQALPPETVVLIDPQKTSYLLERALQAACQVISAPSIPAQLKAIKNETEIRGLRQANVRDGVALARWLYWLGHYSWNTPQTELTLAEKLNSFRQLGEHYQGPSFATICGYQANSAVGHYCARPETTPAIIQDGLLLIDSGAQYLDGTTDLTRTLTFSVPTVEQRRVYTTVLKCHIRLARAIFPAGTTGSQLDAIARDYLWQQGWNCRHGIGHGVGHFLNVHEGPQRFSPENHVPLQPGMLISNEPGVYFEDRYGIRLENLLLTVQKETNQFGQFYGFETVSLCPFDLDLLDLTMLDADEKKWLNNYHRQVYDSIAPFLSKSEQAWLRRDTRQL